MKRVVRYQINFDSGWQVASAAAMGMALFCQMMFFFVLHAPQRAGGGALALYLILPAVLEIGWILTLKCVKVRNVLAYVCFSALICLLLTVQNCVAGGIGYGIFSVLGYLAGMALLSLILLGFLPYKYFGFAWFALLLVIRLLRSELISGIRALDVDQIMAVLPGIFLLAAMMSFFGGISGKKIV